MSDADKSQSRPRVLPSGASGRPLRNTGWLLGGPVLLVVIGFYPFNRPYPLDLAPSVTYTNYHMVEGPWSIHVVRIERSGGPYQIRSVHARGTVLGLGTLWFNGKVRNNPCDGYERAIANSLIVVKKSIVRRPGEPGLDPAAN